MIDFAITMLKWRIFFRFPLAFSPMKTTSPLWSIVWIPAFLSLAPAAIAQNDSQNNDSQNYAQNYSDRLPPAPGAEGYGVPSMTVTNTTGYRLFIPEANASLLAQAKALAPLAFIQTVDGKAVIQVGLYGNELLARQEMSRFQTQGLPIMMQRVGIALAPESQVPPSLPPIQPLLPQNPNGLPIVQTQAKGYYVIIPTAPSDVNFVRSQLNQLGIPPQYIFLRDRPFGIHYAIGVFTQRSQADQLAEAIRSRIQLDSRVHFER